MIVLLALLFVLLRYMYSQRDVIRPRFRKRAGLFRLAALILGLVLVLGAQPVFWISSQLGNYTLIDSSDSFCSLDIYTPADRVPRLIYSIIGGSGNELVEVFPVRETKMRITGEVIEWAQWLSPLGLGTFVKLTGVEFVRPGEYGDIVATSSVPMHRGSFPAFQQLTGWPSKLSLTRTRNVQSEVLRTDSDLLYTVSLKDGQLTLE
jgi:hypothetical protein